MKQKKLGTVQLSGLIIGPILGSGILILPPLAVQVMGNWALYGWGLMVALSFLFAAVFGIISIQFPGDAGVANAVEHAFGMKAKRLTSSYLTGAAVFGPVAVLLTAAKYVNLGDYFSNVIVAYAILVFALFLLLMRVSFIGMMSLIMSSISAVILFSGSLFNLSVSSIDVQPVTPFDPAGFGYGLLLLFWTIVGWEVIGNFSADIKDPKKTMSRAILFSAIAIGMVSLAVALAIQSIEPLGDLTIDDLLRPLFGGNAILLTAVLAFSLCTTTYLAFTGAVSRLLNSLAVEGSLPGFFAKRNRSGAPAAAIFVLVCVHSMILGAVYFNFLNEEKLVSIADGFFLTNALIGILAAIKIIKNKLLKAGSVLLASVFFIILCFSSPLILLVIALMAILILKRSRRNVRVIV